MTDLTMYKKSQPDEVARPATANGAAGRADTILALDLGTITGWALHGRDGTANSGTVSFRPDRFEGGGRAIPESW